MDDRQLEQLKAAARRAAERAYCPYSGFRVGAVVMSCDDRLFSGCNIENASFGLTTCAERTALYGALAGGVAPRAMTALVIYTPGEKLYTSCGACRQVMSELLPADAIVISTCDGEEVFRWRVADALPRPFRLD